MGNSSGCGDRPPAQLASSRGSLSHCQQQPSKLDYLPLSHLCTWGRRSDPTRTAKRRKVEMRHFVIRSPNYYSVILRRWCDFREHCQRNYR